MGNIGIQNLVTALSRVGASAVAQVGPDATTELVPILGLQLTTADFAGGWAVFDAGAFGSDAPPTVAPIASNTTDTLAFAASVLPSAPAEGANVWLYQVGTFNVTVTAPENVAEWGGQPVAAAGPDGLVPAAVDLVPLTAISNQAANTNFGSFTAPWSGTATVLLSLATASVVNLMVTPSGGTEASAGAIQDGATIGAAQPQSFSFPISSGASYAFQVATAQSGNLLIHVKGARN